MNIFQPDTTLHFSPVAQCAAFFVQFGLCGANSYIISGFARHIVGTIDRIFVFVIAFLSQVILITAFLGFAGRLNFILVVALLAALLLFLFSTRSRLRRRKRILARSLGLKPLGVSTPFLDSPVLVLLGFLLFLLASFLFVWAVVTPPPASDAFIYHLVLPTQWMQTGSLIPDRFAPFGESFHPSNPETLLLWMIMPFHEDIITNLISWTFWLLCAFAVYSISISIGARHRDGIAAAMLWLALPLTSRTATSSEVDLMAAFFFLVSVLFLVRYRADRHVVFLLWGGLALGIFVGSKWSALLYSLPVFALYAMLILDREKKKANNMAVFLMAAMLLSVVWFMGNYTLAGNPFYPFRLTSILGKAMTPGVIQRQEVFNTAAKTLGEMNLRLIVAEIFGMYLSIVLIISLAGAAVISFLQKRLVTTSVLLLPFVLTILFWAIGAGGIMSARYLFPAAALACVAWSVVVPKTSSIRLIFYLITASCAAKTLAENDFIINTVFRSLGHTLKGDGMGIIVGPVRWLFLLCFIAGFFLFLAFIVGQRRRRFCLLVGIVLAAIIFSIQYPGLARYYSAAKYTWYRPVSPGLGMAWTTIEEIHPKPLNIAVSGTNLYHGFYGVGLRNRVMKFDYDVYADDSKWILELQTQAARILAVSKVHEDLMGIVYHDAEGFPMDVEVAERHPETFEKFRDFGDVRLYIIRGP